MVADGAGFPGVNAGAAAGSPAAPLLQVADLRTYFHTDQGVGQAVDGVTFHVQAGETVGLVGESGCGKTVTSLSILGLVPSPPGRTLPGSSIRLRGEELVGAPARRLRELRGNVVSMIFQEPMTSLNPVYTVGSQIDEVLRLHRRMNRRQARERTVELLREVGIPEPARRADEYPHQLSGGMRQRVMIAMALACEPALVVADEPTTALDVTIQAQILDLLARLQDRRGMALLLITHDLGVVAEVCDRVVVMYAGQVVEEGTAEEIFGAPTHPYTAGLLASLPRVDAPGARLRPIPGVVPPSTAWPPACRFADRCPYAWPRCLTDPPPLLPLEPGASHPAARAPAPALPFGAAPPDHPRSARCWLVEEPARRVPGAAAEER